MTLFSTAPELPLGTGVLVLITVLLALGVGLGDACDGGGERAKIDLGWDMGLMIAGFLVSTGVVGATSPVILLLAFLLLEELVTEATAGLVVAEDEAIGLDDEDDEDDDAEVRVEDDEDVRLALGADVDNWSWTNII